MTARACLQTFGLTFLCLGFATGSAKGQTDDKPVSAPIPGQPTIADEPRTIDPATLVPKIVAAPVTVEFQESSLREIGEWIQEKQKIPVLFDASALSDAGIPLGEPVSDRSNNAPLYLLLNRLQSLGLDWYVRDQILHITTAIVSEEKLTTVPYNVADLLDAGYKLDSLGEAIQVGTRGPWGDVDGTGGDMQWLGDVQFIRQTDRVHRQVAGLLAALRKHGRRTFINDPPQHQRLREALQQNIDVNFEDVPLVRAIQELGRRGNADIRLDRKSLREEGIRDREPVSLVLTQRKLSTVLKVLLNDMNLTWVLRDGVMWVTTEISAEEEMQTAVYDVRDLCGDDQESAALAAAIPHQTGGTWIDSSGTGGSIVFAKSGTMVVRQTERGLDEVLNLLETYRKALRASKPRKRDVIDPQEVVTRYYRMDAGIAGDMTGLLPTLVKPESWKNEQKPAAVGTILKVSSGPELVAAGGNKVIAAAGTAGKSTTAAMVVPQSVLIIRQTRENHVEVSRIIHLVEQGDPATLGQGLGGIGGAMGGGSLGGGGFGGGFFSLPSSRNK